MLWLGAMVDVRPSWFPAPASRSPTGAIAQLGERLLCTQEVVGSIPSGSTTAAARRWQKTDDRRRSVGGRRCCGVAQRFMSEA